MSHFEGDRAFITQSRMAPHQVVEVVDVIANQFQRLAFAHILVSTQKILEQRRELWRFVEAQLEGKKIEAPAPTPKVTAKTLAVKSLEVDWSKKSLRWKIARVLDRHHDRADLLHAHPQHQATRLDDASDISNVLCAVSSSPDLASVEAATDCEDDETGRKRSATSRLTGTL